MDLIKFLTSRNKNNKQEKIKTEDLFELTVKNIAISIKSVLDPETGIDVVDLGLIYDIQLHNNTVVVKMTMTTPVCPVSGYLKDGVKNEIYLSFKNLDLVDVQEVWEPAWEKEMMSQEAREQFGW